MVRVDIIVIAFLVLNAAPYAVAIVSLLRRPMTHDKYTGRLLRGTE